MLFVDWLTIVHLSNFSPQILFKVDVVDPLFEAAPEAEAVESVDPDNEDKLILCGGWLGRDPGLITWSNTLGI